MADDPVRERRFLVASEQEIRDGRVADVYFANTLAALRGAGLDPHVVAEVRTRKLPGGAHEGIFVGLGEVLGLLEGIAGLDVDGLPEGSRFCAEEPVLVLSGRYTAWALHETALLGMLCQASGIATGAARCRTAAAGRTLLSFGARRQHPALAPMIERAAYIGGADAVSSMLAAELLGIPARGTMPHAFILVVGDTVEAARIFDAQLGPETPRTVLVDTFQDEAVEAVRVASALGQRLAAVRLDTPASRKGDFAQILRDVRWELDLRGFGHVKLVVSGGLGADDLAALHPVVDAFGVGSAISRAPEVDFALDIVEVEGEPRAKRAKHSGRKELWHCPATGERRVLPASAPPPAFSGEGAQRLLQPLLRNGVRVAPADSLSTIRARALR